MALLEKEATRFAESLDDYEHVTVTDIGGWGPIGYWLVVHDHRFDTDYEIASHCDYWFSRSRPRMRGMSQIC